MKQNFFEYNGEKYFTGTEIVFLKYYKCDLDWDYIYFVYYDTEADIVWYKMRFTMQNRGCSMKAFLQSIKEITGNVNESIHVPQAKQLKDSQIPKLVIGWAWYIFIMVLLIIFKDRLIGWVIASIVFFRWREKVIAEEGYYVE